VSKPKNTGTVLPGKNGAATSRLTLQEVTFGVTWNLQGDVANPAFLEEVRSSFDVTLPTAANSVTETPHAAVLWLGPKSWLLLVGGPESRESPWTNFPAKRDALNSVGGALFEVSAGRVAWRLAGPCVTTVLASACPLDLHPREFPPGSCAQSLFGHISTLLWRRAEDDFTLLAARSFAHDIWSALCAASAQHGYEVLPPAPIG